MTDTRILIVEDEGIVAMDLQQRLKSLGYGVAGMAARGEEAVALAGETHPDLVLMDIRLSAGIDGITAAEQIRSRFRIPIIFLTAYADEQTLQRAKVTEPFGYILKPFEERELQTSIEIALYKHKAEMALRQQNEYLTALHETALGLLSRLNLQDLLQAIISHAARLVGTEHGYVFLLEPGGVANGGGPEIVMRVGIGAYTGFVGTRARAGVGLAGTVWQTGQPLVVDDYRRWPGRLAAPSRDILRAVAGVPLKSGAEVIGVLGLAYTEEGHRFDEGAMEALNRFADLASLALDNARLHADLERELEARQRAHEDRLMLEHKLQETQKLESLGVLAGGIAHDFNNLLVSILGNVGLVLLDLEPASPVRESIEQIKIAAQRAADLTKQMLAYSGKGRFVMQPIRLNAIIAEMTQLLQVSINKNARLKFNLAENLPPFEGDATQVRQVVMNLIVNASDAIGERPGVITLTTGYVRADRTYLAQTFMAPDLPEGGYVYLEVADTGAGMDAATRARIFDPFFTTKFAGRGLGLAAVLGIVRGHRGAIKVYSEPGDGTVFRVLFPCQEVKTASGNGSGPEEERRGNGTVLVIDDEDVVRAVTKRMLERFGYTPLVAEDGQSGVQLFRAHQGEIVCTLLDMTMPRMSGEQALREIQKVTPEARVVLMSGYTEEEAISRSAGKGLSGFMQKPYTPEELEEKIHAALAAQ